MLSHPQVGRRHRAGPASATAASTSTRDALVDATVRLIRERGLAAFTTRDIARAAGVSDGALYTYFAGKNALVLECCTRTVPDFLAVLATLPDHIGEGSVSETLTMVARAALRFFTEMAPLSLGIAADRGLLEQTRARWEAMDTGPARVQRAVSAYVRAEQRLGRLRADVAPETVTALVLGPPMLTAYTRHLVGRGAGADEDDAIARGVATLLLGLAGPGSHHAGAAIRAGRDA